MAGRFGMVVLLGAVACGAAPDPVSGADAGVETMPGSADAATPLDAAVLRPDAGLASDGGWRQDVGARVDGGGPDAALSIEFPPRLSETGLYSASDVFSEGVKPFEPRYVLWSDGSTKRRWLLLPPGAAVDASDMDRWRFPVGTKAFKEFSRDGIRIETRMLAKFEQGWAAIAYAWDADQGDAIAVPDGVENALGTEHDIPSAESCGDCHNGLPDMLAGVSAIQLGSGPNFAASPGDAFGLPGDPGTADALGYLHANCGNCHNPKIASQRLDGPQFSFWLEVDRLDRPEATPTYETAISRRTALTPLDGTRARRVIQPGAPDESLLYIRMGRRGEDSGAMPSRGTELVDEVGASTIYDWIRSLPNP